MTIIHGRFEWDSEKDKANIRKHGFSFREILDVFDDPYFYEMYDNRHSEAEERLVGIGSVSGLLVVTTCYTERERIRLISSRQATKQEEALYYEQHDNT